MGLLFFSKRLIFTPNKVFRTSYFLKNVPSPQQNLTISQSLLAISLSPEMLTQVPAHWETLWSGPLKNCLS